MSDGSRSNARNWARRGVMRGALVLAALPASLVIGTPALACARISAVQGGTIAYDPFSIAPVDGRIRVTATLTEGDRCEATVALGDAANAPLRELDIGPGGAAVFRPELVTTAGVATSTDPGAALAQLTTAQPQVTIEWRLVPVTTGVLPPGDHQAAFSAGLREPGHALEPVPGAVVLRSIPRAQINFAGSSAGFEGGSDTANIDLGELIPGRSGRVMLQMRANTPAHLSFQSTNGGALVGREGPAARIPYRLTVDGRTVELGHGVTALAMPAAPTLRGSAYEVLVTVGQFDPAPAGRYTDTITIDVSP